MKSGTAWAGAPRASVRIATIARRIRNCVNGSGGAANVVNDVDLPDDGNQCTDDVCAAGVPSNPPLASGTTCRQSGGTQCDGAGACVP